VQYYILTYYVQHNSFNQAPDNLALLDILTLEESSPKTGSSATHDICCVHWFYDFNLGYLDHIEPTELL
jgi:hypothetical protein